VPSPSLPRGHGRAGAVRRTWTWDPHRGREDGWAKRRVSRVLVLQSSGEGGVIRGFPPRQPSDGTEPLDRVLHVDPSDGPGYPCSVLGRAICILFHCLGPLSATFDAVAKACLSPCLGRPSYYSQQYHYESILDQSVLFSSSLTILAEMKGNLV